MAYLVGDEGGETGFGVFVEAFKQRDAYGVAQRVVFGAVAGGIGVKIVVGPVFLAFRGAGVGEAVAGVFVVKSPDEARHGDVFAGHYGVVFVAGLFPEAHFVAVVHVELLSAHT